MQHATPPATQPDAMQTSAQEDVGASIERPV